MERRRFFAGAVLAGRVAPILSLKKCWHSLARNSRANWCSQVRNSCASAPERDIGAETKGLVMPISCLAWILFQVWVFCHQGAPGIFPFGKPTIFVFF